MSIVIHCSKKFLKVSSRNTYIYISRRCEYNIEFLGMDNLKDSMFCQRSNDVLWFVTHSNQNLIVSSNTCKDCHSHPNMIVLSNTCKDCHSHPHMIVLSNTCKDCHSHSNLNWLYYQIHVHVPQSPKSDQIQCTCTPPTQT